MLSMTPVGWPGSPSSRARPKPSFATGTPPASGRCPGGRGPQARSDRAGPSVERATSTESGGHHRKNDECADEELDVPKPSNATRKLRHLGGRGAVAARGTWPDLDQPICPPRDRRPREGVDPHGENDPGQDRPRPPRIEPGELLGAARCEQVEQAGEDRELGHAEDVAELPW